MDIAIDTLCVQITEQNIKDCKRHIVISSRKKIPALQILIVVVLINIPLLFYKNIAWFLGGISLGVITAFLILILFIKLFNLSRTKTNKNENLIKEDLECLYVQIHFEFFEQGFKINNGKILNYFNYKLLKVNETFVIIKPKEKNKNFILCPLKTIDNLETESVLKKYFSIKQISQFALEHKKSFWEIS